MDITVSIIVLVRFLISFFILFVWLPALVMPIARKESSGLKKLFIYLIPSQLFFIVAIHLLVVLNLLETLSLFFVVGMTAFFIMRYYRKTEDTRTSEIWFIQFMDWLEKEEAWYLALKRLFIRQLTRLRQLWQNVIGILRGSPLYWAVLALSFGAFVYSRFYHSMTHYYFGSADSYVHLKWAKVLTENKLYVDGVYPYGFESIIAALYKFYQLDPYFIVRYIGPFASTLLLLSIVLFIQNQLKGNRWVIVTAIIIFTFAGMLPNTTFRQISALSMEYAAVFFLPGIYFLLEFIKKGVKLYSMLAVMVMMLLVLIHAYAAVCLFIAYVMIGLFHLKSLWKERKLWKLLLHLTAAGIAGLIPFVSGVLAGIEIHDSTANYIKESAQTSTLQTFITNLLQFREGNLLILSFALLALIYLAVKWRNKGIQALDSSMIIVAIVLYIFYRSKELGLPTLIPSDRLGTFLAPILVIVMAIVMHELLQLLFKPITKTAYQFGICIIIGILLIVQGGFPLPQGDKFQYDEAVQSVENIQRQFPYQEWTIISPVEEYPMAMHYGWHYNLWEFVGQISGHDSKPLKIPTNYVFLFVEKVPLGSDTPVIETDAERPFPALEGNPTDYYYRNLENRRYLEAAAFVWAEQFRKSHNNVEIYFDNEKMRIYKISQFALK